MEIKAAFVEQVARRIAEALAFDWGALPEQSAVNKNGLRYPPKTDFLQAAEAAIADCREAMS